MHEIRISPRASSQARLCNRLLPSVLASAPVYGMPWLWLATLLASAVAVSWRHVRIGQPFVDLPDFVLQHTQGLGDDLGSVPDSVEGALMESVGQRGLELDTDTLTDGNCGLDAVLRNLERLGNPNPDAARVLELLARKGRQKATQAMRLMLLLWIRKNRDVLLAPDLTVGQLAVVDGQEPLEHYIHNMAKQGEWIDTPMLLAASAVFHVQLICFVGHGEAQLLAAPSIVGLSEDVPVAFIANANNVHFYACRPAASDEWCSLDASIDDGDGLALPLQSSSADGGCERDVEEPSEGQLCRAASVGALSTQASNLFTFCQAINVWSPFGPPDDRVLDLLKLIEGVPLADTPGLVLEVLQYRDAVKLLQWEALESKLDREHVYQLAKKAMAKSTSQGRYKLFQKSKKIFGKLVLSKIEAGLQKTRQPGHSCTKPFLEHVPSVLRWRKLWYALPKHDREAKLAAFYADQFKAHRETRLGDATGFTAKFQVFGFPVCRQAFIAITGIHADTLQKARGVGIGKNLQPLPAHGVWVMRRPLVYILTRAWLLTYGKAHGDTSPMDDAIYLPAGRKVRPTAGNIIHVPLRFAPLTVKQRSVARVW